ncbi:MAG: hypothetical protein ACJ78Q_12945 [Chloroflexia bacterium]
MKRLVCGCQRFCLCAAFLAVMGGAGAFLGAVGGLILVLISHAVLGMSAGLVEMMTGSVGAGTGLSALLGAILLARQFTTFALPATPARPRLVQPRLIQPQIIPSPAHAPGGAESNQVSS